MTNRNTDAAARFEPGILPTLYLHYLAMRGKLSRALGSARAAKQVSKGSATAPAIRAICTTARYGPAPKPQSFSVSHRAGPSRRTYATETSHAGPSTIPKISMSDTYDIVIIGGGNAGLALACALRQSLLLIKGAEADIGQSTSSRFERPHAFSYWKVVVSTESGHGLAREYGRTV